MPAATGVRTLVLSWSGVLAQLIAETVSFEDLEGAFFYFGCTRHHAYFPGAHGEPDELDGLGDGPLDGRVTHTLLCTALMRAEQEDRVAWRVHGRQTYGQLNELLARFDLPPIDASRARETCSISLPEIHRLVREQGLPYRVISAPGMD